MKKFNKYLIMTLFFLFFSYYLLIFESKEYIDMMFPNMELSGMMWNSTNSFNSLNSLLYLVILVFLLPKITFFKSRWNLITNKFMFNFGLYKNMKYYMIISSMASIIFMLNFYSLFTFNWIPMSQSWLILILTTLFLLSIWTYMIMTGGLKLFGEKIPMSWYILNFMLWFFHNLSFFIRFISLPFRMMMNLIVGMFLIDFSKHLDFLVSFISIYEVFVMLVQTLVFIILANMYYTEMIIMPEWKVHKMTYSFKLNLKFKPYMTLIKIVFMKMMMMMKI